LGYLFFHCALIFHPRGFFLSVFLGPPHFLWRSAICGILRLGGNLLGRVPKPRGWGIFSGGGKASFSRGGSSFFPCCHRFAFFSSMWNWFFTPVVEPWFFGGVFVVCPLSWWCSPRRGGALKGLLVGPAEGVPGVYGTPAAEKKMFSGVRGANPVCGWI